MKVNFHVPDFIQQLLISSEDGLPSLAKKFASLLNIPIIITDPLYEVLASSYEKPREETCHINFEHNFEPELQQAFFDCKWLIEGESLDAVGYLISSQNESFGYIFLITGDSNEDINLDEYEQITSYAASLCASNLKRALEIQAERLNFKDAFLFDLIYGNFKNKAHIISYGAVWHWDFDQPHAIVVFTISDYDHYSTDRQLIKSLPNLIEKKLVQLMIDPIILQKQAEVVVTLPINNENIADNKKQLNEYITFIMEAIFKTNLAERIACGIGQVYDNPTELYRSYQEAKVATELGVLLDVKIPFFDNIGLERILYKHDLQDLREFYYHTLGPLEKYDEENDGELMHNLEVFAFNQFDLTKTSELLFLHRNTLRYRIKRIEEVLNIKLDDMNNRLNILAAFKIRQLHNSKL